MEQLEKQPITIQEYREKLKKKTTNTRGTCKRNVRYILVKALRLTHIKGFPYIQIGRDKRIILSKLDSFQRIM